MILASKGLQNLTVPLFDDKIKLILIKNTDLEFIGENAFLDLKELETLSLNYNKIKKIHKLAFRDLVNVQKIEMIYNHIESLDDEVFSQTQHLKYISLHNNKIKSISSKLFGNNKKLESLQLQNNVISQIESGFYDPLKSLTRLDFSHNICTNQNFFLSRHIPWTKHQNVQLKECFRNFEQFKSENEKIKPSETDKNILQLVSASISKRLPNTTPISEKHTENPEKIKNDLQASIIEVHENLTKQFLSELKILEEKMLNPSDVAKIKSDLLIHMKGHLDNLTKNVSNDLITLREKIEKSPDLETIQKDFKLSLKESGEKMSNQLENDLEKTISQLKTEMTQKIEEKLMESVVGNREKLVSETFDEQNDGLHEKLLKIYYFLLTLACFNVIAGVTTLLVFCKLKKIDKRRFKSTPDFKYESRNQEYLLAY